jgi:hypothetical protein
MIRRDTIDRAGKPAWLLITQLEHAALAADLASAWNLDVPAKLQPELIWTVAHHDDGWQEWEQDPDLDADGRPLDFREMPVEQSNRIWSRSIEQATLHGPLAGYLVASHFLALRDAGTSAEHPGAARFAATEQPRSEQNLRAAQRQWGDALTEQVIDGLCEHLGRFDRLSLMLCCRRPHEPDDFAPAADSGVRCHWLAADQLTLTPWPLRRDALQLTVYAQEVPVRHYQDAQELKQASQSRRLCWTIVRR